MVEGKPAIILKLKTPNQLFDERDPSPFRERDLDDDAVRYIVSSFHELPRSDGAKIALYFATMANFDARVIRNALCSHFEYEAELKRRELRQTFEQGLISLFIGLAFLFACTHGARLLAADPNDPLRSFAHEGLFIMGWVAMWKPISTFLYEWWPIRAAQKAFLAIAALEIVVRPLDGSADAPEAVRNDLKGDAKIDQSSGRQDEMGATIFGRRSGDYAPRSGELGVPNPRDLKIG
jgi:hypothetical protein